MEDEREQEQQRQEQHSDNSQDDDDDGQQQGSDDDDTSADNELLNMMQGNQQQEGQAQSQDNTPAGPPQGVDAKTWKQFQEFQAAKQAAPAQSVQQQQAQQQEDAAPVDFSLSEDEYDTVGWVSKESATEAIKRAMATVKQQVLAEFKNSGMVTQEAVQQQLQQAYYSNLRATEMMIHLKDTVAEQPELYEWPEAFNHVLNKALGDPKIDPREAVEKARKEYMKAYRVSGNVGETQKRGRKIDVRGEQKPPTGGKTLTRSNAQGESEDPTGLGVLAGLYSRGR